MGTAASRAQVDEFSAELRDLYARGASEASIRAAVKEQLQFIPPGQLQAVLNEHDSSGYALVHIAAMKGMGAAVAELLSHGADPCNVTSADGGFTALHFAVRSPATQAVVRHICDVTIDRYQKVRAY